MEDEREILGQMLLGLNEVQVVRFAVGLETIVDLGDDLNHLDDVLVELSETELVVVELH